jgi:putative component of toxin-antitoxin plasmid stabilization module
MARAKSAGTSEPPPPAHPLNTIHQGGSQRRIAFAKLKDGSEPAKQFYDSLTDDDKDHFDALFLWICDRGAITNDRKFHPSVGEIKCVHGGSAKGFVVSEFKVRRGPGYRIFAVLERDTYVLTHGCNKPKKKQFETEVARAERHYCEDRARRLATLPQ